MRDDGARWNRPTMPGFEMDGLSLRHVPVTGQTMVSGPDVAALHGSAVGWPEVARGTDYAVSMRRDRVLLVGTASAAAGFDPERGIAVSDVSDGFVVLDLAGPRALACLKQGAELDLDHPSRSAMRHIFGTEVLLYRHGAEQSFRLHVPRACMTAFAAHLDLAAAG